MVARRFHSRRVWLLHGLLLVAVLAVAYVSGRAQYRAVRDQRLEEMRVHQQNSARTTAVLIEQNIRFLAVALPILDHPPGTSDVIPRAWIEALADVNRNTQQVTAVSNEVVQRISKCMTVRPEMLKITAPTVVNVDGELVLVVPTSEASVVRIAILSKAQISQELQSVQSRIAGAESFLGVDGWVISENGSTTLGEIIPSEDARRMVRTLIDAGGVGTPIIELSPAHPVALLTVQPVIPMPGVKWFLLIKRDRVDAQIDRTLRPVIWQLISSASMMVLAVTVVLVSTTISLFRGRRRIEHLRMEMLNRDLQKARAIQLHWLPAPIRETTEYAIAAINEPAAHISGDFYNWFDLPTNPQNPKRRTAVVIGDVSGHGLPAAFLMATTQLIISTTLPAMGDPGRCLTNLNRQLCSLAYNGQFVTIMILLIDHEQHSISIASAGQAAPLLKRNRTCSPLAQDTQLVIGVDETISYASQVHPFHPGDDLLLYTDGVTETTNNAGEQFGMSRLIDAFLVAPDDPTRALHSVVGAVATHRQGGDADDDLTMVALRVFAVPQSGNEAGMV